MMWRHVMTGLLASWVVLMSLVSVARAEQDHFAVGAEVPVFTLKAVNTEDSGASYVGLDTYFSAGGTEPKKGVLLSFFATYCEPCKREMPFLAALYSAYKDKGLMVLSVSIDKEADKVDFVKNLAKQSGVTFPVLSDRFNIVAKRFMISRLPCLYLLGADGKVALVSVGYNDDISTQILDGVRKVVGEPTSDPVPEQIAKVMGSHSAAKQVASDAAVAPAAAPAEDASAKKGDTKKKQRGKVKRAKRRGAAAP